MLTLIRRIRGLRSPEMKGFVGIEVKSEELSTLWKGIDLGKDSYFLSLIMRDGFNTMPIPG